MEKIEGQLEIQGAKDSEWSDIWPIFKSVIEAEDTFVFPANITKDQAFGHWFANGVQTYLARINNVVVGTYILKENQIGLGSHVANASYMVSENARGVGLGRALAEHSFMEAKNQSFLAMQFNLVVSSNVKAVKLWKKLGFEVVGTSPKSFKHSSLGYVDSYIMYKEL